MREKRLELLRLSAVASKTTVATVTPLSQPPLKYSSFRGESKGRFPELTAFCVKKNLMCFLERVMLKGIITGRL